jgi:hypothetical protein
MNCVLIKKNETLSFSCGHDFHIDCTLSLIIIKLFLQVKAPFILNLSNAKNQPKQFIDNRIYLQVI